MRFILNGRFFSQPTTGVQRYAANLARRRLGVDAETVVAIPRGGLVPIEEAGPARSRLAPGMGHAWEQLWLPRLVGAGDLLVGLANYGPRRIRNQVVTLHDASTAIVPETFSRRHRMLFERFGVAAARAARRVVTHSERSKIDIVDRYGIKPDLISVVPCGVGPEFSPGDGVDPPTPYCVFVGAHDPRKNLGFLAGLWPAVERRTGLRLIAVGRSASRAHAAAGSEGVDVRTDLSDDDLRSLYRGATLVLQPSRYEGFGLPILEGAACGTPFLSSDVGAALELAVDPDRQVLPLDAEAWVEAIVAFAELDAWGRAELASRSLDVAARYSWDNSARALGLVLMAAAEESP